MKLGFGSYRASLTRYESAIAYALLGVLAGLLSGSVVIAFEHGIEQLALVIGVGGRADDFEALPPLLRGLLPVVGALLLGLVFTGLRPEDREVGIVHVISRLHTSYGMLPWRNAVVQFFGGIVALASGISGGREGPGVHLGGAANSVAGQLLALPNNSLRILIACGSAGGIAAAFNTPLAGVIFAMEVIVSEYTVAGFMPVMLSAVAASALSRQFGGGSEIFDLASAQLASLWEIPFVVLLGIFCGCCAALFIRLSTLTAQLANWPIVLRFTLAGMVTGGLGILVPEALGMGYDTLGKVLFDDVALSALIIIGSAKIFATAIAIGSGMPIGIIGPSLLVGACAGAAVAGVVQTLNPGVALDAGLYAMLGMAAAMGAVFAAPLAAILAIIELTQSTSIAMPALLAIIAAHLTNQVVFRQRPAHRSVLRQLERQVPDDPLNQLLHRTDVSTVFDGSVVVIGEQINRSAARALAVQVPNWCLVNRDGESLFLVSGPELLAWIEGTEPQEVQDDDLHHYHVTESSLRRWSIAAVPEQATLRQAADMLRTRTVEAVCVYSRGSGRERHLRGVITRERIERFTLDRLHP